MIGNTVPKAQSSLRTMISIVQISLGDIPLTVGRLQIFSVIRGLSSSRKSEKRVFYEIVWTSVVYFLLLNCIHWAFSPSVPDMIRLGCCSHGFPLAELHIRSCPSPSLPVGNSLLVSDGGQTFFGFLKRCLLLGTLSGA